ncbi:MAG: 50S ribosomal protein L22 [Oscillospiraceae bacterium]|nr:50S ribosomal protein L22 [Oscillospiraceae bacterium]
MEARATLNNVRISPRKVQIVLDLIRNQPIEKAQATLRLTPKAASPILEKLLKSAVANADNNNNMNKDKLYVSACYVTPGPIMKRIMPRAQGRAYRILKRTSHITIVVKEQED